METRSPGIGRVLVMVAFALSCFGLLLFLWVAFGGSVPLAPKGYRVDVRFTEANQLADQADVRISGVPVGKVVAIERGTADTAATIELEPRYAPLPSDARAVLRSKTLLGETYVELTPGTRSAEPIPEGGTLDPGRVAETVELDELLRAFDPDTRDDLRDWLVQFARALDGRARDISDAVGNAEPLVDEAGGLLAVLDRRRAATSRLIRDTGRVLAAIGARDADAGRLIRATDAVLRTTAEQDARLRETLRILPTFLREVRPTLDEAERTADEAAPVLAALRPVAPLVRPTLRDVTAAAPDLEALFGDLGPVLSAARTGLPAADATVRAARPLVRALWPTGLDLAPVVDYLGAYRQEVVTMFASVAAATQATYTPPGATDPIHYLRIIAPVHNETFADQPQRLPTNRPNPYFAPRALDALATGLEAFDCRQTANPQTRPVIGPGQAPPCKLQPPQTFGGVTAKFPRLTRAKP